MWKKIKAAVHHLVYDEVIESVVVRYDEVLLDVHEVVGCCGPQLIELFPELLQRPLEELVNAVTWTTKTKLIEKICHYNVSTGQKSHNFLIGNKKKN